MQTRNFRRVLCALLVSAVVSSLLAACSNANDPYAKLKDAPLVQGHLHTVTLVSDDTKLADQVQKGGYRHLPFPPNYPEADKVQGVLWDVPDSVAKNATIYGAPDGGPNVRVLIEPLPLPATPADDSVQRSFYRNVLGADVPQWPAKVTRAANVRVHVWTYQVASIIEARKKLRENAVPVITEPVGFTTPYLGDQKSMSLRAPDGAIVELVETNAQ